MTHHFVVCGFYTESYRNDFERLEISLQLFGMEYDYLEVEPLPTWEATTGLKPKILLQLLDKHPGKDLFYLDADAFIRKPLGGFDQYSGDIGLHFNECQGKKASHRIRTGSIYVRNNDKARAFLRTWIATQGDHLHLNDQDSFELAYQQHQDIEFFNLPVSYVKIFDKDGVKPYVEHFQASRRVADQKFKSRRHARKQRYQRLLVLLLLSWGLMFYLGRLSS